MHFGFELELWDIDLRNTDLLDTYLDLLSPDKYTDIPSKYFVCLRKIFKTSSRHVFKTSSRHVFKASSRRLQDVFSVAIFCLPRRLQDALQEVFKTSSRPTNVYWDVYCAKITLQIDLNFIGYFCITPIFLGYSLRKLPKHNFLCLYLRIPNFTATDQIWWNDYEVILRNCFSKLENLFFQNG